MLGNIYFFALNTFCLQQVYLQSDAFNTLQTIHSEIFLHFLEEGRPL